MLLASSGNKKKRPFRGVFLFQPTFWQVTGWTLLSLSWLNASHYRPWVNFQSELMALTGLALLTLVAGSRYKPGTYQHWPTSALVVLATSVIPLVHWLTGLTPFGGDFYISTLYLGALAAAIVVGHELGADDSSGTQAIIPWGAVLWAPALVSALVGILQWLDYSEVLGTLANHGDLGDRPMGNVAQTNQLASLLLMGASGAWFDFERRKLGRFTFILMLSLMSFVMALTQSRTGLLSTIAIAVFLTLKIRSTSVRWRTPKGLPLFWATILGVTFLAVPLLGDALHLGGNRNIGLFDPNSRLLLWAQIAHAIVQSPWWGYGWNQTATAHSIGALAHPGELTYTYAHNFVLDILAWCGVPLGIALTMALAIWFVLRIRQAANLAGVAAMAALLPVAIHSQLEFPFAYAYFLVNAGVLVGVIEADTRASSIYFFSLPNRLFATVILALVTLGIYASYEYVQVEEDFRVVRFEGLHVGATPAGYHPPSIYILTQLGSMLQAARVQIRPGMESKEITLLQKVSLRFPYGALGYRYALALALNGDMAGAKLQLKTLRSMYGPRYYAGLVQDIRGKQKQYPELNQLVLD